MSTGYGTSSERVNQDGKVSWNNYDGTKSSHDIQATQMNSKDTTTNDHTFYNTKSGVMGVAGGNRDR